MANILGSYPKAMGSSPVPATILVKGIKKRKETKIMFKHNGIANKIAIDVRPHDIISDIVEFIHNADINGNRRV